MLAQTRTRRLRVVLLVVAAFAGVAAKAADPALRWKFRAGDSVRYEFNQKNEFTVKANGQEMVNSTDLTFGMTWKVKSVGADGAGEIAMVINRVQAKIQVGGQTIKYDSNEEKPADDPSSKALDAVYRPAVGQEYALKIDPRGQVLTAKVPDKVTQALKESPFQALADGGSVLSETGLKNLFVQVIPSFPETSVAKGGSWKSKVELPTPPLRLTVENTYTLSAVDAATSKIESQIDTSIKTEPNAPFKVEVKKQTGKGSYTIDTKAGRLTSSDIHQTIEINLNVMDRMIEQVIKIDAKLTALP
jgi:hypothetical protein